MKLAKSSAILWVVLAISFAIVPAVGAQTCAGEEGRA